MAGPDRENSIVLTLENAGFSFGETPVFTGVNLAVSRGETLCLLGPNGCGKTTLIDCILGINKLHTGRITMDHRPVQTLSPKHRAQMIAYVPQKHSRYFSFSVLDVLLMGRSPYTSFYSAPNAGDILQAQTILDTLGLSHLAHRDYTRLSGGETQLVMIMRALIQDTPIIVMDEPTAHLDFKHELTVLETIVRLVKEKQLTLIMATHFPNHAFYFENSGIPVQVAFMGGQTVHPAGTPSQALTQKNLETFYHVNASVITHPVPGKGILKHIIPIQTTDNDK
jgi:iron complex transport system ATP-binding protein